MSLVKTIYLKDKKGQRTEEKQKDTICLLVITFSRMRDADTKQRIEIVISAVLFFIVPDICRENDLMRSFIIICL